MAQSSLYELVTAMATQIRDALHSEDLPVQVEVGIVTTPTPISFDIHMGSGLREPEPAGMGEIAGAYVFTIRGRLSGDLDAIQEIQFDLLDDTHELCLAAALYEDPTLGGHASDLSVTDFSGWQDIGGYFGASWTVSVIRAYS